MTKYLVRRVGQAIVALFMLSIVLFAWLRALPGGPVSALLGERSTPAEREALEKALGLDQPLYVQYFAFLKRSLSADFGVSTGVLPGLDAMEIFLSRLLVTVDSYALAPQLDVPAPNSLGI